MQDAISLLRVSCDISGKLGVGVLTQGFMQVTSSPDWSQGLGDELNCLSWQMS